MEAIGIAASIVGVIAAAGKVGEILSDVLPSLTRLQHNAVALSSEVRSTEIVLCILQKFVAEPTTIVSKRRDLIQLEQLLAILTDGVLIFSELEALVTMLGTPADALRSRLRWGRREKELGVLYTRLCSFKGTMSLMLNILQW
jgi:hypothetical protein